MIKNLLTRVSYFFKNIKNEDFLKNEKKKKLIRLSIHFTKE